MDDLLVMWHSWGAAEPIASAAFEVLNGPKSEAELEATLRGAWQATLLELPDLATRLVKRTAPASSAGRAAPSERLHLRYSPISPRPTWIAGRLKLWTLKQCLSVVEADTAFERVRHAANLPDNMLGDLNKPAENLAKLKWAKCFDASGALARRQVIAVRAFHVICDGKSCQRRARHTAETDLTDFPGLSQVASLSKSFTAFFATCHPNASTLQRTGLSMAQRSPV